MYLLSSFAGPVLVLAGLAGMFGFGIPSPYWLASVLFGAAMILVGQRGLKQTREVRATDPADMEALAQKRHRFWIFVAIASSLYAAGAFWLPAATPEMRDRLVGAIMLITFGLCVGIFLYSMFTKKKP
jgi:uncharacterized membrane protein